MGGVAHLLTGFVVLVTVITAVPSPSALLWLIRTLALSVAPILAVLAALGAAGEFTFGAGGYAIVAGVLSALSGAYFLLVTARQWRQARALGVRPSLWAVVAQVGSFLRTDRPGITGPHVDHVVARDGTRLPVGIWSPDPIGPGRRPAVVLVHGGGWVGGNWRQLRGYATWLAEHGYVTVCLSYRLAPPARWDVAPADVLDGLRWVDERAEALRVDPHRVALLGSSAGGQLALLAGSLPERATPLAAMVAIYPPTDLPLLYRTLRGTRVSPVGSDVPALTTYLGSTPEQSASSWRWSSPSTHLDTAPPAVYLATGAKDQWTPLAAIEPYAARLRADPANLVVPLVDADHCFDLVWGSVPAQTLRATMLAFLDREVRGDT